MAALDLATELMDSLTPNAYSERITALTTETMINNKMLQLLKTTFKERYEFSSDVFRARNGTPKPTGMLDLFAKYSGADPNDIRKDMIKYVRSNNTSVSEVCKEALDYKSMTLRAWIAKMSLRKSVCDEISLYVLCKLYSRHVIIYTTKGYWTTVNQTNLLGLAGSEIEGKCDLVLFHTEKGLVLCKEIKPVCGDEPKNGTAGNATVSPEEKKKRKTRSTRSIQSLLKETQDKEKEKSNKVSAKLSVNHILPDSDKTYNTRLSTPLRRRHNFREKRPSCENKNYSDNLDMYHLDSPPSKRSK